MAGQNERSSPVVMQYVNGQTEIVWPTAITHRRPGAAVAEGPHLRRSSAARCRTRGPFALITARGRDRAFPVASACAISSMLSVDGLTKVFGGFTAVDRVSFDVSEGEILGLIGPNGSGKSTTFNLIAGALAPTGGSIRFLGRGDRRARRRAASATSGIGRTFQIPRPFRKLSLLENVALAAYYGQAERAVAREGLRAGRGGARAGRACRPSRTRARRRAGRGGR